MTKKNKKKLALPRRQWKLNPVTRVKQSGKTYSRPRVKRDIAQHEE